MREKFFKLIFLGFYERLSWTSISPRRSTEIYSYALIIFIGLIFTSCAALPDGTNISADRRTYAYQNEPRLASTIRPDPDFDQKQQQNARAAEGLVMDFTAGYGGATIASSDVPWRIPLECRLQYRHWLGGRAEHFGAQDIWLATGACPVSPKRTFVGAAITGGGNKSAVYATEVLFELGRYGLADEIDVVSSVSGGSFAALHYALTCDPASPECAVAKPGWRRPIWDYKEATKQMESNYFWPFVGTRFLPHHLYYNLTTQHGSADDLAQVVSARLLHDKQDPLTFADLNPQRPNLILNATNVTRSRPDFDSNSGIPRRFQRPLSDDEALHFSFTQQYFWRLLSNLDRYPLKDALVASSAFPLIIDKPSLRRYSIADIMKLRGGESRPTPSRSPTETPPSPVAYVSLYDGGVRDNFGVSELQWLVQCQFGVDAKGAERAIRLQERTCGKAVRVQSPEALLIIGINSSLLRSEGVDHEVPKPRAWDSYVLPVRISGTAESVNMIMAASGEMRKTQLRQLVEALNRPSIPPENPAQANGLFKYLDIDIEATQILYCPDKIARDGRYTGRPGTDWLLNSATGGSDRSRCEGLQGILEWNTHRNLQLPTVEAGFCSTEDDCPELEPLAGRRKLMLDERDSPALGKMFIGNDTRSSARLLNNRLLFDSVREVPTDFQLPSRYALLLRYVARWSVAHRVWQLCEWNRDLVSKLRVGYYRVCEAPLPSRPINDGIGSDVYRAAIR